jgi:hypothetical protein
MIVWNRASAFALMMAVTALVGCGGSSSPSSPTPPRTGAVTVAYAPNPSPYAGATGTTAICLAAANVWKFTTTFTETGGVAVTLTSVVTSLDGAAQASVAINFAVPASGTLANSAEICFQTSTQHTLQHTFSGTDSQGRAITVTGPQLVFSAR